MECLFPCKFLVFHAVPLCHLGRVWLWGWLVVFQREESFGGVDDIIGHLLVAAEVVSGKLAYFAVDFHVGRGVDAVGGFVPIEQGGFEGFPFHILDEHPATEFPQPLSVVVVGGVAGDVGIYLVGLVEAFDKESFLE